MAKVLLLISDHDHNDWIVRLLEQDGLCSVTRTADPFEYARQIEAGGWDLILSTCLINGDAWPQQRTEDLFNKRENLPICFLSFTRPTSGMPWINKNLSSDEIKNWLISLLFAYDTAQQYLLA